MSGIIAELLLIYQNPTARFPLTEEIKMGEVLIGIATIMNTVSILILFLVVKRMI